MTHNVEFPGLGLSFSFNTTAFSIGGFSVQWYGIIITCGFILAITYAYFMAKKMNINRDKLFDAVIVGLIMGVIGARAYYVLFFAGDMYINNPLEIFNIKEGGLGIYGGIIGGLLGGAIVAKIRKLHVRSVLDIASLGFLIGQCIGRWGNFINQEAFGGATDLPWGMKSDMTSLEVVGNVHPCFLYESLWCLVGFILLHLFTRYLRRYDGQTFLLYVIWYGTGRFFIEGLRTDSLLLPFADLRISQVLAAVSVIAAVVLLIVFSRRTSLSGCGSKKIMELNGIVMGSEETSAKAESKDGANSDSTEKSDSRYDSIIDDEDSDETAVPEEFTLTEENSESEETIESDADIDSEKTEDIGESNNAKDESAEEPGTDEPAENEDKN